MKEWLVEYDKRLKINLINRDDRSKNMLEINPKYTLKNYILQEAIKDAEDGDYTTLKNLFKVATSPYDEHPEFERWAGATPNRYKNLKLSCSS